MTRRQHGTFENLLLPKERMQRFFIWGDAVVLLLIAVLLYGGVRLAFNAPAEIRRLSIHLALRALSGYTLLSVGRMTAAYPSLNTLGRKTKQRAYWRSCSYMERLVFGRDSTEARC
ncbi:MAG: hypothetical protein N2049_08500 [Anaerolineales bacterium]|nr:hypothetical protein [Anaerolineales bacterium]MCX7609239.1 hypothetical protein [Anaerolineales bacterium]MDW8228011.1 hypothetical protein [Anaerolineales bacterium]